MESVSNWLHAVLKSHVLPDDKVTKQHNALVELRMKQMEELLPSVNKVFEEVKVEMAGSVQSNSKVSNTEGPCLTRILGLEKNRVMQNSRYVVGL
jgi:hypothetical protein